MRLFFTDWAAERRDIHRNGREIISRVVAKSAMKRRGDRSETRLAAAEAQSNDFRFQSPKRCHAFRFLQTAARAAVRRFLSQVAVSSEERQHEAEGAGKVPQYLVSQ